MLHFNITEVRMYCMSTVNVIVTPQFPKQQTILNNNSNQCQSSLLNDVFFCVLIREIHHFCFLGCLLDCRSSLSMPQFFRWISCHIENRILKIWDLFQKIRKEERWDKRAPKKYHYLEEPKVVMESKLILLAARQANNLRNKLLGQVIATLFGKQTKKIVDQGPKEPSYLS